MAATFRPVNNPISPGPQREDIMTTSPTTPRSCVPPTTSHQIASPITTITTTTTMDDATTPTRATFSSGALAAQKPLPTSPFPDAVQIPETVDNLPKRENSQHSRKSRDSDEMDMDESDGETGAGDDGASDDESVNADGTKSNKKKKSQRFYCTDYPPCNLSFTRSEHLARHIRKHTGERPFQCHCSRRFSRLDNLRQHAQTVHVNEDIPIDSLAATGTRFQRQIRTDRVRTPGGRARASTAGSLGAPVRGHSKSLSTSSIASISSVGSAYSGREDVRRRPPPLVMAADPRARHSLESYRSAAAAAAAAADGQQYPLRPISPSDFSTPTSATFSTGQSSPRWGSGVASPISSHSRSQSMYATGSRTPGRRLSVPSSGNPLQSPHGMNLGRHLFAPGGSINSPNSAVFSPSNNSSLLSSPTAAGAGASGWSRRESMSSNADDAWRRRTWHPDTREYSTVSSRLSSVVTPSQFQSPAAPLPIAAPSQQSSVRLPGIESFGPLPRRPGSPGLHSIPSPMAIDSEGPIPIPAPPHETTTEASADERRGVPQWDMGLHRGLTRLEIASSSTPPRDSASSWATEANQVIQAQAEQARVNPPTVRFEAETQVVQLPPNASSSTGPSMSRSHHQHTMSAPVINDTPREMKRRGWYHGPVTVTSASGETTTTADHRGSRVDRMVHPNLAHGFSGFPARVPQTVHEQQPHHHHHHQQQQHEQYHQQQQQQQQPHLGPDHNTNRDNLRGLDALVAVATSEGNIATAC